jgi:cell wall-associated NlpC family hydrolase
MSIQDVQARVSDIQARLQALAGGTPLAGGVIGAPPPDATDPASFASALTQAQGTPTAAPATSADTGSSAVALAEQQVGTPYVFGGSTPAGFDCSGLVQWTYGKLGVTLPRTAAEQGKVGTAVSPADARPGDLVYFDHAGPVDHIGIYAGNGTWVVAPHTGAKVRVEAVDLSKATSIRRVTGDQPAAAPGAWSASLPVAGKPYAAMVQRAAEATGLDPRLLSAVAWTESGFSPSATSAAGAQGLMQLMPQTAAGLGVDAQDPQQALLGGARYLKQQLDAFGGRADLALAAYNAGPTAVRKAGGIPPYQETQAYVTRVLDRFHQLGGAA